jgi:Bacterial dnaA protein helix-turn-helix
MAELTDDSFFPSFAHPLCTQPPPTADDLLDPLQVILQRLIACRSSAQLISLARATLAEIKRIQTAHQLATISELVALRFHLSPHHLRARARDQRTVFCRQVAMHLCRRLTGTSFTFIGSYFDRDHSTCIYACRLIERRRQRDAAFRRFIEQLADQITGALPATMERFNRPTARTEPKPILIGTTLAAAELANPSTPPPAPNSFAVIYQGVTV